MQVTFLIGNGFDLGIGLKTAYSDFIECIVLKHKKMTRISGTLSPLFS